MKKNPQPFFWPKLFSTLKAYSLPLFWGDLSAGIIVGIVALPLSIAFSIASGVSPERGLMTAIVAGFLISSLGGSRVQIGGATGAFAVIIYRVIEMHGLQGLMICTVMAGALLILMGVLRWGAVIKYIPFPLTVGFTAGIAVLIASSQVKDFLGLKTGALPSDFLAKWWVYFKSIGSVDPWTVAFSLASLLIIFLWPRVSRKIPGSLIAILLMTFLAQVFRLPVSTIGSGFHLSLQQTPWLQFHLSDVASLVNPALTIALLGAIQSLLSATVADGLIEGRHRSNTELIAQGIANMVVPFVGGIPATGAVARTLTNVKNGGKTPVAGIVHSIFLLIVVLLFGRWISKIPLSVLAAILMVVSYNMAEWHAFKTILRAPRSDVIVMLTTFLLTVFVDLTVGVEVGLFMAFALFVKRMSNVAVIREIKGEMESDENGEAALRGDRDAVGRRQISKEVSVYEAEGAFFFGVAELLRDTLDVGQAPPKVLILRMRHVLALDATGLRALQDLLKQCRRNKTQLLLSGIHVQPMFAMERSGFLEEMGEENILETIDQALNRADKITRS